MFSSKLRSFYPLIILAFLVVALALTFHSQLSSIFTTTGLGSLGHETTYFGNATKQALGKFQLANQLVTSAGDPSYGYWEARTQTLINGIK